MNNFYTAPKHKTQTIEKFFDEGLSAQIVKSYQKAQKILAKSYRRPLRLAEINFGNVDQSITVDTFRFWMPTLRSGYITVKYNDENNIHISKVREAKLFPWLESIVQYMHTRFEEYQIPAKVINLNIHNLERSIPIHTDGVNISKRNEPRPDSFPEYDPKDYYPLEYTDYAHQGLITLQNDGEKNGTIIFDQWCPISNYLIQHNPYDKYNKKANIIFYKGEKLERFGFTVNEYTYQDMSNDDFEKIKNSSDGSITKEQCYGLSLDKILLFGSTGTLNVWPVKKYHLPIPLPNDDWSKNRIMLQYETSYW